VELLVQLGGEDDKCKGEIILNCLIKSELIVKWGCVMDKFYKTSGLDEKWGHSLWVLCMRVVIPTLRESGVSSLQGELGAKGFIVLCVWSISSFGG